MRAKYSNKILCCLMAAVLSCALIPASSFAVQSSSGQDNNDTTYDSSFTTNEESGGRGNNDVILAADVDESLEGSTYVAGEVLVTLKSDATSPETQEVLQQSQTIATEVVRDEEIVDDDTVVAKVSDGVTVAQAMSELQGNPEVESVQPNYIYQLMDDDSDTGEVSFGEEGIAPLTTTTNDPWSPGSSPAASWYISSIEADDAWDVVECNNTVGVAVLDTGVDLDHPDLVHNIVGATSSTTGETDTSADDTSGHGTHVCGIVAAEANNGVGVAGVSFNANIIPIRVFKRNGECATADIVKGYDYVMEHASDSDKNIKVVNMSLGAAGTYDSSDSVDVALKNAIVDANGIGILTVCASGNAGNYKVDGQNKYYSAPFDCWPGNFDTAIGSDTILTVGNIDSNDVRSSGSNYGPTLDVVAPGTSIYSTVMNGNYGYKNGTSMSAPMAAACAALCFATNPDATVDEVRSALENTATDLGTPNKDDEYGYGKINAYQAVLDVLPSGITLLYDLDFSGVDTSQTYTGQSINPIVISHNGIPLVEGTDYTISFDDNVNAGTVRATIEALPNSTQYKGRTTKTFTISPAALPANALADIGNQTYTGSAIEPDPVVKVGGTTLIKGTDYTVSYANNVQAGTATVTVTGKGNYSGTATKTFTISPAPLPADAIAPISSQTYTGSAIEPDPVVKVGSTTLTKGTDYDVSYSNNIAIGTATVTVTGKGNYSGTASKNFTIARIVLRPAAIAAIDNQTYTGSAIEPAPVVTINGITLVAGTDYDVSYINNTNVGTATVTVTGKGNCIGSASRTFVITAAPTPPATNTVTVYRLYNEALHSEHLFTTDASEVRSLVANWGWTYEGAGWYAPDQGDPVYRLYNPGLGSHLYTKDVNEVNNLVANWGWVKDFGGAPAFYSGGSNAIYRMYNPKLFGQHLLTTSATEYSFLTGHDWLQEGHMMDCVQLDNQYLPLP